jgi:protein involved in polysaccharide export with SLBB domain
MAPSSIRRFALIITVLHVLVSGKSLADPPRDATKPIANARTDGIRPLPAVPIPDDPPPHEGAMIDLPYVVEPPDLLQVEVLEALPGRPISGERLVRPDGTITLGFYGDVYVRGLTCPQIKAKIIAQLKDYLDDEALGIEVPVPREPAKPPVPRGMRDPLEHLKGGVRSTLRVKSEAAPAMVTVGQASSRIQGEGMYVRPRPSAPPRLRARVRPNQFDEAQGGEPANGAPQLRPGGRVQGQPTVRIDPEKSDRVFVDIAAYHSKSYTVLRYTSVTGRFPFMGNETVLDAINNASGLHATANPNDIRLVRPASAGKPAKVYKVNYRAITEEGDVRSNYQVFPGDRVIVGRAVAAKKSTEPER